VIAPDRPVQAHQPVSVGCAVTAAAARGAVVVVVGSVGGGDVVGGVPVWVSVKTVLVLLVGSGSIPLMAPAMASGHAPDEPVPTTAGTV
jgi:hypothetical protein